MNKIRSFCVIDFTIFAVLVLLQALMHQAGIVDEFDSIIVIQYFILSSLLTATTILFNFLAGRIPVMARLSVLIAIAFVEVVFLGGIVMHWYTIRAKWILLSLILCVVITAILYFITGAFSTKNTAEQINRAIRINRMTAEDKCADDMQEVKEQDER